MLQQLGGAVAVRSAADEPGEGNVLQGGELRQEHVALKDEAHAGVAFAAGDQPDGRDADLDRLPRAHRWQDRLDEGSWRTLEGDLLGGRSATFCSPPALAIRDFCHCAHAQQTTVQPQHVEAPRDRTGRWRVSARSQ